MLSLPLRRERSGQFVILGTIGCLCGMFYRFTADALPFIGTGLINIKKKKKNYNGIVCSPFPSAGRGRDGMSLRRRRVPPGLVIALVLFVFWTGCFGPCSSANADGQCDALSASRFRRDSGGIVWLSFVPHWGTALVAGALPLIGTAPQKKKKKKIYFLSGALSSSLRFLACFPPAGPPRVFPPR